VRLRNTKLELLCSVYLTRMSHRKPVLSHSIVGAAFGFYTADDIRKISVKRIWNPQTYDHLNAPNRGGLYDPALGPLDKTFGNCETCGLSDAECPGHFGHIELPVPLYNPITFKALYRIMRLICFNCYHFRMSSSRVRRFLDILRLINCDRIEDAKKLETEMEEVQITLESDKDQKEDNSSQQQQQQQQFNFENEDVLREHLTKPLLDYRKKIINKFIKSVPSQMCENCNAYKLTIRQDNAKLFVKRLPDAKLLRMWHQGIHYRSPEHTNGVESSNSHENEKDDPFVQWLFKMNEAKFKEQLTNESNDKAEDIGEELNPESEVTDSDDNAENKEEIIPFSEVEPTSGTPNTESKPKKKKSKKEVDQTRIAKDVENQRYLSPQEVKQRLKLLWDNEPQIVSYIWSSLIKGQDGRKQRLSSHEMFFVDVILVTPTRFRPPSEHDGQLSEHPQNVHLSRILSIAKQMEELASDPQEKDSKNKTSRKEVTYVELWVQLQQTLNAYADNKSTRAQGTDPLGIKQLLEKKDGLFRKNMMGKRVNFAARSVISPDPYIETNEIGVPLFFAMNLTYPEPVTPQNLSWLRQLVINGPKRHPGANKIEDEDGNIIVLSENEAKRAGVAKRLATPSLKGGYGVKKVYRHLVNGDYLLVNRQPTLHKPSIMCHRARVFGKENTIQMHYANCSTYNADFDGDEMNLHLPQNEMARAEAKTILITDQQYIVPKDGTPIRGLIQDHIVSGVLLTCRDTFLTRDMFQQLLYGSCWNTNPQYPIVTPMPTILKPRPLWTGKQLVSAVLNQLTVGRKPLNLNSKEQIPDEMWGKNSMESTVIIKDNELLCGVLGKKQFGAKPHGLVHAVYELYGATEAGKLLTTLGRLFTLFLQVRGFTCGIDDMLLTKEAEKKRFELIEKANQSGLEQAAIFTGLRQKDSTEPMSKSPNEVMAKLEEALFNKEEAANWDKFMIGYLGDVTSKIIEACFPSGQVKRFPKNNLALMTISGAKGSQVNFSQISCLLGQQELEGKRVPRMVSGRTLPCFAPYDPSPRAGGWITDRFLTGIRPIEYYFHCMAGREGLIDTAVKTSRSGYLQRCLIKHLEGLTVAYDQTVRDSDSVVIEFHYGGDSLDVTKTSFLNEFDFLANNMQILVESYDLEKLKDSVKFVPNKAIRRALGIRKTKKGSGIAEDQREKGDPVLSKYMPSCYLGAVSEKFEVALRNYIANNPAKFSKNPNKYQLDPDIFRSMMYLKYMHSLVQPGEAVGVLAAQSIGEPSTQMTLNTFHLAGKGDVNVTLGIPRLREIIMTAGANSTPSMILPLKRDHGPKEAEWLMKQLYRVSLIELIDDIVVEESLETSQNIHIRIYRVTIILKDLKDRYVFGWEYLCRRLETIFIPLIVRKISDILKIKKPPLIGKNTEFRFYDEVPPGPSENDIEDSDLKEKNDIVKAKKQKGSINEEGTWAEIQRQKKTEMKGYENDDESEREHPSPSPSPENESENASQINEEESEIAEDENENQNQHENDSPNQRKEKLLASSEILKNYQFNEQDSTIKLEFVTPANKPKLLMMSLLEEECQRFHVREVPNIKKCYLIKPTANEPRYKLQTQGVNFEAIWQMASFLDVNEIYCNDIVTILSYYGVEAARAAIVNEISNVFRAYGITVDTRHLGLIADYMTHEGGIKACNRTGIESNSSPFLKMSFETTMHFLTEAALSGEYDKIKTPSSLLAVGKPTQVGTGSFDVRYNFAPLLQSTNK